MRSRLCGGGEFTLGKGSASLDTGRVRERHDEIGCEINAPDTGSRSGCDYGSLVKVRDQVSAYGEQAGHDHGPP